MNDINNVDHTNIWRSLVTDQLKQTQNYFSHLPFQTFWYSSKPYNSFFEQSKNIIVQNGKLLGNKKRKIQVVEVVKEDIKSVENVHSTTSNENNSEKTVQKKKPGRKALSLQPNEEVIDLNKMSSNVHTKKTKDNVRRKVKVQFTHFLINFLNQCIRVNWKGFQKYKFRTIDNRITKDISIRTNKLLFNKTVGDYLSYPVSSKFKCDTDQNKRITFKITKEKPHVFNQFLDMNMVDFYNDVYRGNPEEIRENLGFNKYNSEKKKNKLFFFEEYLPTLKNDLEYLMIYYNVGINFFSFYMGQKGRKPRSDKQGDFL